MTRRFLILAALFCLLLGTSAANAALVAQYHLDGNAGDSVGTFDGFNNNGGFVDSPYGGGLALDLNAGQYVDTVTSGGTASSMGIGGANARTISAWARPESFNNGSIFEIGASGASGDMFGLRTTANDNVFRAQFWAGDFDFTAPSSKSNWGHYTLTYDGTTANGYYNGMAVGSRTRVLTTDDDRPFEIGRYAGGTTFDGQIDEVQVYNHAMTAAEVKADFQAQGGFAEDFEGYGDQIDTDIWYTSGGMNSTRLRSNRGGPGTYLLSTFDNDANDPTDNARNVYNVHQDNVTSLTWGQPLRVLDDTGKLIFNLAGGSFAAVDGSQRGGGVGLALWDLEANDFVRDDTDIRLVTRSGNGGLQAQSISLDGLEGRTIMPVLYDRQVGSWAWAEIDNISALPGTVETLAGVGHQVLLEYAFDEPDDYMGWTGDTASFAIGDSGGGLLARHINLNETFTQGAGFLSSALPGNWDAPTGELQSPEFVLAGDILEFYISGGGPTRPNLAFELWVDMNDDGIFTTERTSQHQADGGEFDYDFWTIADLVGKSAYLRLYDGNGGSWGHIQVDAIRMVALSVPEPSTMASLLIGLVGLGFVGWRRRKK